MVKNRCTPCECDPFKRLNSRVCQEEDEDSCLDDCSICAKAPYSQESEEGMGCECNPPDTCEYYQDDSCSCESCIRKKLEALNEKPIDLHIETIEMEPSPVGSAICDCNDTGASTSFICTPTCGLSKEFAPCIGTCGGKKEEKRATCVPKCMKPLPPCVAPRPCVKGPPCLRSEPCGVGLRINQDSNEDLFTIETPPCAPLPPCPSCKPPPPCAPPPCAPPPCAPLPCAPLPCAPLPCTPLPCAPLPCTPPPCIPPPCTPPPCPPLLCSLASCLKPPPVPCVKLPPCLLDEFPTPIPCIPDCKTAPQASKVCGFECVKPKACKPTCGSKRKPAKHATNHVCSMASLGNIALIFAAIRNHLSYSIKQLEQKDLCTYQKNVCDLHCSQVYNCSKAVQNSEENLLEELRDEVAQIKADLQCYISSRRKKKKKKSKSKCPGSLM